MLQVSDTIFTWSDLQAKNNGELLANLGNFINRGLKFVADRLGSTIPEAKGAASNEAIIALGKEVQENVKEYVGKLEKVSFFERFETAIYRHIVARNRMCCQLSLEVAFAAEMRLVHHCTRNAKGYVGELDKVC
jgi:methionyl-tRNA synthetase